MSVKGELAGSRMPRAIQDYFRYLPVTPRDEQWGLYVTAAGSMAVPGGVDFVATGHSASHDFTWQRGRVLQEYAIVYLAQGRCEFESKQTGTRAVGRGGVLLLFPGVWHRYRPDRELGWESYWVTFQGNYADQLCARGFLSPEEPVLHAGFDERIMHGFTALLDHVRGEPLGLQQLVAADTLQILANVRSAVRHQQTSGRVHELVRRAILAIESAMKDLPAIHEMATDLGISRSYFHQVFKECTGLSPYQYHLQLQMSRARQLLRGSRLPINQIAEAVKFQSPYQFCRTFRRKTGMSPSQYRAGGRYGAAPRQSSPRAKTWN